MSIKGKLDPVQKYRTIVKFDDAIPDLIVDVPPNHANLTKWKLSILEKVKDGNFTGGHDHMHIMDYMQEILNDDVWYQTEPQTLNEDITFILDQIGTEQRIQMVKVINYLTGCGLKKGKEFMETYLKTKSDLNSICYDHQDSDEPDNMGFINMR